MDGEGCGARAVELAEFQYREGAVDYTRVLNTQQFLVTEQDRLVATRGSVVLNLVAVYKALGGGWELRVGKDLVPPETKQQMAERTWGGGMLTTEGQTQDLDAAASGCRSELQNHPNCPATWHLLSLASSNPQEARNSQEQAAARCPAYAPSVLRQACEFPCRGLPLDLEATYLETCRRSRLVGPNRVP